MARTRIDLQIETTSPLVRKLIGSGIGESNWSGEDPDRIVKVTYTEYEANIQEIYPDTYYSIPTITTAKQGDTLLSDTGRFFVYDEPGSRWVLWYSFDTSSAVISNNTLTGSGTPGDPLSVNTLIVALKGDLNPLLEGVDNGDNTYTFTSKDGSNSFTIDLTFSTGGVQSVTGDGVDNTDPNNPILSFPDADEVDDSSTTNKFVTQALINLLNSAVQPGDNISDLTNDSGYVNAPQAASAAPVQSVNGETGTVTLDSTDVGAIPMTQKGSNGGVAELDANGHVPTSQLPSFVDDVIEVANFASLPGTGESGKIYITIDDNLTYRWGGSAYVLISSSLALGETSSTAYRGDRGKIAYDHSQLTTGNPHNVTKANVGLGNVDNTSDVNKPISTAVQNALNGKFDQPSGTTAQYIRGNGTLATFPTIPNSLDDLSGDSDDIQEGSNNLFLTTTERNKLSGIASGAEVNVNSDWNAVSGDAEILNKPTLGTAAAANIGDFATAAQGALADTAVQPTDDIDATTLDGRNKHLYGYYTQIGGQARKDLGMNGLYDRAVTTDADLRGGGITVNIIAGSANIPTTSVWLNAQSDHAQLSNITPGTEVDIIIDNGENAGVYSAAQWQPFFQKRLSTNSEGRFRHIKVSVSQDQITWATPSNGAWEITDFHDDPSNFEPQGFWFGGNDNPGISAWRYVKFELKDFVQGSHGSYGDSIYIVQLGIRHVSEMYARQYMRWRDYRNELATAAQGAKADTAVQPGDLATVATTGAYSDLTGAPAIPNSLDDLSGNSDDITEGSTQLFFTLTERNKLSGIAAGAEVNVNPDWNAVSGDAEILNKPTLGTAAAADTGDFATATQGTKADTAVQPGDNVSDLTNDANYIDSSGAPVQSVNGDTGAVVLDADDIDDTSTTNKFVTAVEKSDIATAVQPGDLATVATSGAYSDLSGTPTIPDDSTDLTDSADLIRNNTDTYVSTDKATQIVTLTQAEYDAIVTPVAGTLYIVT